MVGRLAYNYPWHLYAIDQALFNHDKPSLTREQILLDYADFAQREQDEEMDKGLYIQNSVLVKPLTNFFSGEFDGGAYRKLIGEKSIEKAYKGRVRDVILETMDFYKQRNPQALQTINSQVVVRPLDTPIDPSMQVYN